MLLTTLEYFLFMATVLSLGSFSAAFSTRWPIKQAYLWEKEAHFALTLPFNKPPPEQMQNIRSCCKNCGQKLLWYDLTPLVSYLILKGKCRHCAYRISFHYPVIELLHLICCLPLLLTYENAYPLLLQTLLISALITAATIDREYMLIPDECNIVILSCALLFHLSTRTLESSVIGMLMGYSLIYSLRWSYQRFRHKEGIGLGDAKLVAALSAWLGISYLAPLLLCASLMGILYTLAFNKSGTQHMAFGPFLIFSAMMVFYLTL